MKTSKKILVCVILILTGLAVGGIGYKMGGHFYGFNWGANGFNLTSFGDFRDNSNASYAVKYDNIEVRKFENIELESSFGDVELRESDHYGVEYCVPEYMVADISVADSTLKVTIKSDNYVSFGLGFDSDCYCYVYYPAGRKLGDITVEVSSGNITMDDIGCLSVDVHSSFGNINAGTVDSADVKATSSSGNIDIKTIETQTCYFETSFGNIVLGDVVANNNIELDTSSGDITVSELESSNIDIENSFGSVTVGLVGNANDYNYDIKTSFGDVSVFGQDCGEKYFDDNGAHKDVVISCSSGSIVIE